MQRFTLPRDLYHGPGALEALKTLKGNRAIVCVGGGSMKRGGFLQKVQAYLEEAGMEVKLFEGIEPDPSVTTVMKGAQVMEEFQPDWIVAIGGGSPIDAAKAMWIKYEYPEITFEQMIVPFGIPELRQKAKFVAIPSTSGTATEVTAFSVITDYEKGIKYPLADFNITPDIAIVDPSLAETMPPKLVAHTGMDAMTHAVEAYVSTCNCDYTDPLAIHAIELIQANLVKSYNGDMDARATMHNAQCLAGQAFSNALLGIVHSMAHKTGAVFADQGAHIIHGAANAMYLPKVIQYNAKNEEAKKRYGVIADYMHLGGENDDEKVKNLVAYLRKMNDDLNIPQSINHYGANGLPAEVGFVSEEVFLERLDSIAANAILDACTGSNPRQPNQEEMVKLLKAVYYDLDVDF
ncbi:iron-containing alcohol dehydrogenase [Floccifex sp.]|uniref:iron-containing alcohol dehydrogenase n=1 Tax=Floccifex sp. TaxID=2815810 RepID=UPI003F0A375D